MGAAPFASAMVTIETKSISVRRPAMAARLPRSNPMGTDGFEFVEYTAPDPQLLRSLFERLGFPGGRPPPQQERDPAFAGRHQLHHQRRAGFVRPEVRAGARTVRCAPWGSACRDAAAAFERAVALGAEPHRGSVGPMELNIPAIVGIGGSLIYFVDRYGDRSIYDVDFKPVTAQPLERAGLLQIDHLTHNVHRGNMDKWTGVLRKAVQLPRDPLLRHRRQEDRAVLARADESLRQDPHPDQRVAGRQVADRGIPARVQGRGHPAHRARRPTTSTHRRRAARPRRRVPGHARDVLRRHRRARRRPQRGRRGAAQAAHPHRRQRRQPTKASCCRSSRPT